MANTFSADILIQSPDPAAAAEFYVNELGFTVTDHNPEIVALQGKSLSLFIERGPSLGGGVLEVTVKNVDHSKVALQAAGCVVLKDEPDFPRCYVRDPNGLIYNLKQQGNPPEGGVTVSTGS